MAMSPAHGTNRDKDARRRAILEVIAARQLGTQRALGAALGALGHPVSQGTLSRDLRALGVVRAPAPQGGYRYVRPEEVDPNGGPERLRRAVRDDVRSVESAGNLVVVKAAAGSAQAVAAAIDGAQWPDVLGTVAGDDTLLVIVRTTRDGEQLAGRIRGIERSRGAR